MFESLSWEVLQPMLLNWGRSLLAALAVLVLGYLATKLIVGSVRRAMRRTQTDEIVVQFASTIVRVGLMGFVGVLVLEQLGVEMTSLIAALGAVGLAVGLALRDSLSNFAAGLMLVAQRPFAADDFIEAAGTSGIVEDISLITTTLRTPDNRSVIVPNGAIYHGIIINHSARARRRVDMVFGIGYGDDIGRAREILSRLLRDDPRILEDPEPLVAVHELGDSSVNFVVRPWVAADDYWSVYRALTERVKLAFDEAGISIPFPQSDVHLHQVA